MNRWRLVSAMVAALSVLGGPAGSADGAAEIPDLARGRALYENHCQVCHTPRVHGRPNPLPLNAEELRQIVEHWSRQENLRWGPEEVEDVVFYLRRTRYNF